MVTQPNRREYGSGLPGLVAIHTGATAFAVLVLALVERVGLPDALTGMLLFAVIPASLLAAGLFGATMRAEDYFQAGRRVPTLTNGIAGASDWIGGALYLGLVAAFFGNADSGLTMLIGWTGGFALLVLLVAPAIGRSEAASPAEFLGRRFASRAVRALAALAVIAIALPFLIAEIAILLLLAESVLHVGPAGALALALGGAVLAALAGGMRALTFGHVLFFGILAFAVLAPAIILALHLAELPDPLAALGRSVTGAGPDIATPELLQNGALALAMMLGTAGMPHLMLRARASSGGKTARRSMLLSFVLVGLVALLLAAYALLGGFMLNEAIDGRGIDRLPRWIYDYGAQGLVSVCGAEARSPSALVVACPAMVDGDALFSAADIAIEPFAFAALVPVIAGLPYILTALVGIAAIGAILNAAGSLGFVAANALSEDIGAVLTGPRTSNGRRLFLARLAFLAIAVFAAFAALAAPDIMTLIGWSFGFAAATLLPVTLIAILWPAAGRAAAFAGLAFGLVATGGYYAATTNGWLAPWPYLGIDEGGLRNAVAGLLILPLTAIVVAAVALAPAGLNRLRGRLRKPAAEPAQQTVPDSEETTKEPA